MFEERRSKKTLYRRDKLAQENNGSRPNQKKQDQECSDTRRAGLNETIYCIESRRKGSPGSDKCPWINDKRLIARAFHCHIGLQGNATEDEYQRSAWIISKKTSRILDRDKRWIVKRYEKGAPDLLVNDEDCITIMLLLY